MNKTNSTLEGTEEKGEMNLEDHEAKENLEDVTLETTTNSTNTTANATVTPPKPKKEYEYITKQREVTYHKLHKIKLTREKVENITYLNQSPEEVKISKAFLKGFKDYEEEKRKLSFKKNELERFVSDFKLWAEDKKEFLKENEIELFLNKSQEVDDYMYSDEIYEATF